MKKLLVTSALLAFSVSASALDLKQLGQQAVNQGVQNAVTGAIEGKSGKEILKDLSFQIHEGEFVAVVGEVGSGKSSLLLSLFNPMGTIATDIAAQKAAQKAGGGEKGQLASDFVKGVSGAIQTKMTTPAPEAAPAATPTTEAQKTPSTNASETAKTATNKPKANKGKKKAKAKK